MHDNSIAAWKVFDSGTRNRDVCEALSVAKRPVTDREVARKLGSEDMNYCRPSITQLIDDGYLVHDGNIQCAVTGRTVRTVRLATNEERMNTTPRGVQRKHHGALWRTMCADLGIDPSTADPSAIARSVHALSEAGEILKTIAEKSPLFSGVISGVIDALIKPNRIRKDTEE